MKKIIFLLAVLFLPTTVYANDITVLLDGVTVVFEDVQPVIIQGRTHVPIRGVFDFDGIFHRVGR
ncbi:MAG: hypothetical protein FWB80_07660 [Defluviitaleaceae bacterium]|nr:hypothetical protein [Defluviitaleaceae bacterium]